MTGAGCVIRDDRDQWILGVVLRILGVVRSLGITTSTRAEI